MPDGSPTQDTLVLVLSEFRDSSGAMPGRESIYKAKVLAARNPDRAWHLLDRPERTDPILLRLAHNNEVLRELTFNGVEV